MEGRCVGAGGKVRENMDKVAFVRGPVCYCMEEADNGRELHRILLPRDSAFTEEYRPELLGGVTVLRCMGRAEEGERERLYTTRPPELGEKRELLWIPYYAWANRNEGEMLVWVRDSRC